MKELTCGFIGLGLIGGSIAKALKKHSEKIQILAYDIDAAALSSAETEGIVQKCFYELNSETASAFGHCDFLFLCAPVSKNDENLKLLKEHLSPSCILTDVGSVKSTIHQTIEEEHLESFFIGGHPMAGSEKSGYKNANSLLLENAFYVLTPTEKVSKDKIDIYKELVSSIGAIPLVLDYHKHDYATAAISHLPHIIASSLVNLVRDSDDAEGLMKLIAAGGFKDITRIASSSPVMWQQICLTNTDNIDKLLVDYIVYLTKIREDLKKKNASALFDLFANAKEYRDSFVNTSSGPIQKVYEIYIDIQDKTGALALTATILAQNDISIKNIGIMHNREFQEGALRIEFYDEAASKNAIKILRKNNYTIYER